MQAPAPLSLNDRHRLANLKLEVRLCISPTAAFYSTVRLAVLSLRRLGPPYSLARVVVSVGDCATLAEIQAANAWSLDYPVIWRAVSHALFLEQSYLATHNDRYFYPTDADVVLMCDNDVCLVQQVDDVLFQVAQPGRRIVAASQAHRPIGPYEAHGEAWWRSLFARYGYAQDAIRHPYALDLHREFGLAPYYFNYGFVALSRAAFEAVAPFEASFNALGQKLLGDSGFMVQLSLALLVQELGLEVVPLSLAYNCPNDDEAFAGVGPWRFDDESAIACVHFQRATQMDRRSFVCDPAAYDAFMRHENLNRVNQRLRRHLQDIATFASPLYSVS
jgi:hypothetical protein